MTWVKLATTFAEDDRWLEAGGNAMAVHVSALCYSARNLTDGAMSTAMARRLTLAVHPTEAMEAIDRLVKMNFWATTETGYQIVNYTKDQVASEDILRTRERWADDKRWRRQHRVGDHALCPPERCPAARGEKPSSAQTAEPASHPDKPDVPAGQGKSPPRKRGMSRPLDPTRPDPTQREGRKGKGKTGTASGGRAASRPAASAPPVRERTPIIPSKPQPTPEEVERSKCPHGMVRGLSFSEGKRRCSVCDGLLPRRRSTQFETWMTESWVLGAYLKRHKMTCTLPSDTEVANEVGEQMWREQTTVPSYVYHSQHEPLRRFCVAHVVEQVEPGRVAEVLARHNKRPDTEESS